MEHGDGRLKPGPALRLALAYLSSVSGVGAIWTTRFWLAAKEYRGNPRESHDFGCHQTMNSSFNATLLALGTDRSAWDEVETRARYGEQQHPKRSIEAWEALLSEHRK